VRLEAGSFTGKGDKGVAVAMLETFATLLESGIDQAAAQQLRWSRTSDLLSSMKMHICGRGRGSLHSGSSQAPSDAESSDAQADGRSMVRTMQGPAAEQGCAAADRQQGGRRAAALESSAPSRRSSIRKMIESSIGSVEHPGRTHRTGPTAPNVATLPHTQPSAGPSEIKEHAGGPLDA
jgi:hypothetical protein